MTRETKLAIRRRVLSVLRAIVWHVDEWLHRQEIALREELNAEPKAHERRGQHPATGHRLTVSPGSGGHASPQKNQADTEKRVMPQARPLRAFGPTFKRRRMTAAEFDLRFAR